MSINAKNDRSNVVNKQDLGGATFTPQLRDLNKYLFIDGFSKTTLCVYNEIVYLFNTNEGVAFPSYNYFLRELNITSATVSKAIKKLVRVKLVGKMSDKGQRNLYLPYYPLDEEEFKRAFPIASNKREATIAKSKRKSKTDKERLENYQKKIEKAEEEE
ncbi:helix-turn-helix domain-containing protein [Halobacillus kuroshimensis]|uniref:helix-turn-helix domain-containing protein n=1 Tax=Halobacillus kuroshimensis TaxID=302481 RepID=UPI000488B8C1|nr:helix-turn-helix domain-containing protein [Halobacillus kuroshimensis]